MSQAFHGGQVLDAANELGCRTGSFLISAQISTYWLRALPEPNGNDGRRTSPGILNLMLRRLHSVWRNCMRWIEIRILRRRGRSMGST